MNPVQVDFCHGELIASLVRCHKPKSVLELGFGSGFSSRKILAALDANEAGPLDASYGSSSKYTLVDSWLDWREKGQPPPNVDEFRTTRTTIVESTEQNFVFETKDTWDFIFSDADHFNAEKWCDHVFDNLLNKNGILIYHDIMLNPPPGGGFWFPNLGKILERTRERKLSHFLFNKNSLSDEQCWRGMLVIFKN